MTADILIDTGRREFRYRGFTIAQTADGWEWASKDASGLCKTVFDAVEAVEAALMSEAA